MFATPPAGSLGDTFDGRLALPRPMPTAADAEPLGVGRRPERIVIFEQQLHWLIPIAWVTLALGLASTGPLGRMAPVWYLAAALSAGVAVMLLRFTLTFSRGMGQGVGIAVVSIIMMFVSINSPTGFAPVGGILPMPGGIAKQSVSDDDRFLRLPEELRIKSGPRPDRETEQEITKAWMLKVAMLASCAMLSCNESEVVRPFYGFDTSRTPPDPEYRYMPTLNVESDCLHSSFVTFKIMEGREYHSPPDAASRAQEIFSWVRDPMSPFGESPFGVVIRGSQVMVWSIGPDQKLDFSPMRSFRPENSDYQDAIIPLTYDPTNGSQSAGDIWIVHGFSEKDCPDISGGW